MRFLLLSLLFPAGLLPAAENIPLPVSVEALPGNGTDPNKYFVREYRVSNLVVEWGMEEERRKIPEAAKTKEPDFLTSGGVMFPPSNYAMYSRATETMIVKDTAAGHAKWTAKIDGWKKAYENHLKEEKAKEAKKPTPKSEESHFTK